MITNPTPIAAAIFSGMWITDLGIFLSTTDKSRGFIGGNMLPYDGTHLLSAGGVNIWVGDLGTKRTNDFILDGVLTNLVTECQRQASSTIDIDFISVIATNPAYPVGAMIKFVDDTYHTIEDCYALCATDSQFAGVFMATMVEIARQTGLEIQ